MTSTCGGRWPLARSRSRCSTPNRCCSSTTTSPRSANSTPSDSSAWVPTTMPARPSATSASAARRAAVRSEPVSRVTRVPSGSPSSSPALPSGPSSPAMPRACCAASTSVGASSAAWPPASTTWAMARSATTVLPDPTSPCSSRCIGCSRPISAASASPTSRWPSVSSKGSSASTASASPPSRRGRAMPGSSAAARRRAARVTCRTSASSHLRRWSARSTSSGVSGWCLSQIAVASDISPCRRRTGPGTGSATSSWSAAAGESRTSLIDFCSTQLDTLLLAG